MYLSEVWAQFIDFLLRGPQLPLGFHGIGTKKFIVLVNRFCDIKAPYPESAWPFTFFSNLIPSEKPVEETQSQHQTPKEDVLLSGHGTIDALSRGQAGSETPQAEVVVLVVMPNTIKSFNDFDPSLRQHVGASNTRPLKDQWRNIRTCANDDIPFCPNGARRGISSVQELRIGHKLWVRLVYHTYGFLLFIEQNFDHLLFTQHMQIRIISTL